MTTGSNMNMGLARTANPRFSPNNGSLAYGNSPGDLDFQNPYEYGGYQAPQLGGFSQGIKNFSLGANAFTGLAGVYNAYQMSQLGKEQFGIEKKAINRNLSNESLAYNDTINQRVLAGLRINEIQPGTPEYKAAMKAAEKRHVDGTPIA